MTFSLLYVSESRLTPPNIDDQVQQLVDQSIAWNRSAAITGALIFTERHFAQFIEGPEDAVRSLMARIERDTRHSNVVVRLAELADRRRFDDWSMAYWGPERFLEPMIAPLFGGAVADDLNQRIADLLDLMEGYVGQSDS